MTSYGYGPPFVPGFIGGDPCDTNHSGPHCPEACVHTIYDHDVCCYLPLGCLGGCGQPGGCMTPPLPEEAPCPTPWAT